jgi:hypothetical protein
MQLRRMIPAFLAAIAAGSLHCAELLPFLEANAAPSIEFTQIPPAEQGGREKVDAISGKGRNARPSSGLLFMRTAGNGGRKPGCLTSDRDGDR